MVQEYKPLYTAKETAQMLHVSPVTVYRLMNSGRLPYMVVGVKARRVKGRDLEKFIDDYPVASEISAG